MVAVGTEHLTRIQSIGHKISLAANAADQLGKYNSLPCPGETAGIGRSMPAAVVGRPPRPGEGEPRPNTPSDSRLELGEGNSMIQPAGIAPSLLQINMKRG